MLEREKLSLLPIEFYQEAKNPFVDRNSAAQYFENPLFPGPPDKVCMKQYLRGIASPLVNQLEEKFQLSKRGKILNVGAGDEFPIVQQLSSLVPVYSLSIFSYPDEYPQSRRSDTVYDGDVKLVNHHNSALRDKKFGTILYWGSWDTSGAGDRNSMIGNTIYKRTKRENPEVPLEEIRRKVSQERDAIFQATRQVLADNGLFLIVSARYSFYGGGFNHEQIDHELLSFLDAIRRGFDINAQRAYILGRTREEMSQLLWKESSPLASRKFASESRNAAVNALLERLVFPLELPAEIVDSFLTPEDISQAKIVWESTPAKNEIGYIDSVIIEF